MSSISTQPELCINDFDWSKVILYHGTTRNSWDRIKNKGFTIPDKENNWLGRGMYFGVNNIITAVKYAFQKYELLGNGSADEPLIVKINACDLSPHYLNHILDLTTDKGLVYFFLISERFRQLVDELNKTDATIQKYKQDFIQSPVYSDKAKRFLSLDIEWYVFTKLIEPTIQNLSFRTSLVNDLRDICNIHISNLVIDWYNYFESGGREQNVPIKGIMASFNTGDPLLLSPYLKDLSDRMERVFYDFIAYLNRIELSIFGFQYYQAYARDSGWDINNLFDNRKLICREIVGEGPIKNELMHIVGNTQFPGLMGEEMRHLVNVLLNEIRKQADIL